MPDALFVRDLVVRAGDVELVRGASLHVAAGEIVALVGASGSGKSMTARACLGLVRPRPGVVGGVVEVVAGGESIRPYSPPRPADREREFRRIRGRLVGYLPQEATESLDPLLTIGRQVDMVCALREVVNGKSRDDWLRLAGFGHPHAVAALYPHELSGGMARRACIALALARGSRFLIADEPTTGLDPTVRIGVIDEIRSLARLGIGVLFITHDLRLVPGFAVRVAVMHEGRVCEELDANALATAHEAPTRALLDATARIAGGRL